MKISLSIRDDLVAQVRRVAVIAGISDSSVAEIALKRLFASGNEREVAKMLIKEGATARRHTGKTWIDAFYAALREFVPAKMRRGGSGFEFLRYDVIATDKQDRVLVHLFVANIPEGKAVTGGTGYTFAIDKSPTESARVVASWLQAQPENNAQGG